MARLASLTPPLRRPDATSDLDSDLSEDEHGHQHRAGPGHAGHAAAVIPASAATFTGDLSMVAVLGGGGDDAGTGTCQVAGCGKDLAGLKEYHQRYRICELHIRLPQVCSFLGRGMGGAQGCG